MERVRDLERQVARPLHFLVVGVASEDRVRQLAGSFRSITLASKGPVMKGPDEPWEPEQRWLPEIEARATTRAELIRGRIESWNSLCEELTLDPRPNDPHPESFVERGALPPGLLRGLEIQISPDRSSVGLQ